MQRSPILAIVLVVAIAATASAEAASPAVDSITGLALYPGTPAPDRMAKPQHYCGKQMEMSFALGPENAKVQAVVAWYEAHLPAARHSQVKAGATSDRSQDTFFMPDGLRQVTITGTPKSDAVYAISYGHFSVALTAKEIAGFNTGNQTCGA